MDTKQPLALLGGLTPAQFMRHHWQKKPLLVRQAIPGFTAPLPRADLFALAGQEGVESRLVQQTDDVWKLQHGPFARRALPPLQRPDWTLLVQGVDLHNDSVHALMQQFRFVPDARLDDVMISYASDGGGVGPHFDSYDVFLLQAHGQRRWRIGRQKNLSLRDDVPMKILSHFEPEEEYVLEPGDMLYLPPRWAHDGIAQGECMTYSVGFRVPERTDLAQELLVRLADEDDGATAALLYRDAKQPAVAQPAEIPATLQEFARDALQRALAQPRALERALGEYLTEPKFNVWFEPGPEGVLLEQAVLDRRTRMMYDADHVFINGESYRAAGRDATLMRQLADQRTLGPRDLARASDGALELLSSWCDAGWMHAQKPSPGR
ncbi:cupin domain-containing protein [Simplicispira metamorpha]|uniref:50S ribosomal protein L16 3-hydroxylase n=1 Tax=Simplicispira metamorpha TaxID=80881 RepID=A0A4R2NG73_9BURK|nr:cupin domain-containing protein [Simplicispira metamorpha]TCP20114.1 50S ribosomal protein L16 3-hydroxylase [Simplicispira metamorpha]